MKALEIKALHKSFGNTQALRGVSLSIPEGEIFGFLGPNGAGKSTTIRCLMDFIRPTAGTIRVFGQDAHTSSVQLKRLIGYVPAEPSLYEAWTGDEHIDFITTMRGVDKAAAGRLKDELGLNGRIKVRHLSTGNQQKLAIILGLLGNPRLLVLDEPTRGLDPLLQASFHRLLRDYQADGGTVFLSSHDLPEVDELCSQVAVIRQGQLVANNSLAELKARSAYNFQVAFGGKVPDVRKAGAENVVRTDHSLQFTVRGNVAPVLQILAQSNVTSLQVGRASLEQLFMELYS